MIDFALTEEQLSWQKKAKEFAQKEIRPAAMEADRNPDTRPFNWELIKKASRQGFLHLRAPKEYGGASLTIPTLAIIVEELGWGDAGVAFTCLAGFPEAVYLNGNEEQKKRFCPPFADKENPKLTSFALTEPGAGSDAASIITTAKLEGDAYVLNGTKHFISQGGLASLYTVYASTDRSKGARGICCFIVPGDSRGLSVAKVEDKMGFRFSHTAELVLDSVPIPRSNLLGQEGAGFGMAMESLNVARVLTCGAMGVGVARAAYEAVLAHTKETNRFGRPLLHQQAISFTLADMLASLEAARALVWKTCWMMDQQMPSTREASMTKFYGSDMALRVTSQAVQLMGFAAYRKETPVEKFMRDAKLFQIYEGTNQIQRLVVSRLL